ncbi:MAG: hypothetical protein ACOC0O_02725 [Spirochaetota bacterium]
MRNVLLLAVVFGVVGLVIGYLIFARAPVTGELISIGNLIQPPNDLIGEIVSELSQFSEIRRNILYTGAGGVVVGIVLGVIVSRR